ncbi:hypothetical protein PUNSTDRAFT_127998 [Punctularia strigosozonata HHB-11173 SS5]|uniref:F-box domain-containing protein n=1 Tax=Punctularia strigosozonata (strain HHB-11173) TaxID=741275 RepID=R7S443_PUNST|nr:uncharacterized protein PUNSTDRAFT_127998 [Punctularia strigosozonata HHB-11173 SS5]EIN05150.1 hypothetical protein PUNSTDRAFT_127998 [Punctularia strigosozonata HHB-11173 SS5]
MDIWNLHCTICGGPTGQRLWNEEDDDFIDFKELPGLTLDDTHWIGRSSVVVYADCLSLPGEFDDDTGILYATGDEVIGDEDGDDLLLEKRDPVLRPKDAPLSPLGRGEYICASADRMLVHELCIRLAASWTKEARPAAFRGDGLSNTAKFFWTNQGPGCIWAYEADMKLDDDEDYDTRAYLVKSRAAHKAARRPARINIADNWQNRKFLYGYSEDDTSSRAWQKSLYEVYYHQADYGITHLKRPDRFPDVHELPTELPVPSPSSFFPFNLPADIVLHLLSELDGPSMHALERTSRVWHDFLQSKLAQQHVWLPLLRKCHYTPTDADWTESADAIRQTLVSPERRATVDWRRYHIDCSRSSNMINRARIHCSVQIIGQWLGHFDPA